MARPVIAVDLDDVVYPTAQYLAETLGQRFGVTIDAYGGDLRLRDALAAAAGMTPEAAAELSKEAFLHESFAEMTPFPAAVAALTELARDYEIVAVTARSNDSHELTRRVIKRDLDGVIREVFFPNVGGWSESLVEIDKVPHLIEAGATWLIDDKLSHLLPLAGTSIRGGLFGDYPWNRHDKLPQGIVRLADWSSVVRALRSGS